jgi:formylglycine-generating enzyme required for sulfatase activity
VTPSFANTATLTFIAALGYACTQDAGAAIQCDRDCIFAERDSKTGCCRGALALNMPAPPPMEMVDVPAGQTLLGCNDALDKFCKEDEKPSKTVDVKAFKIDKTEVTVLQYAQCVKANACTPPDKGKTCTWTTAGHENHPVNCVDFKQAEAYCKWAGKRLPTENEWVMAARGTDGRNYPWGNEEPTCERTNMRGCGGKTVAAGTKAGDKSPFGAMDMGGNVVEWLSDEPVVDGEGEFGPFPWHTLHSASYLSEAQFARISSRYRYVTRVRDVVVGFRCAQ